MWNLSKILSAVWGFTGVATLITLFAVYANFSEPVDLTTFDLAYSIDKQSFFAIFSGLYLAVNLITFVAIKTIGEGKKIMKSMIANQQLPLLVALKIMVNGANTFLAILMIYLKSGFDGASKLESWQWLGIMIGPVLVVAGLIYLLGIVINHAKQR